MKGLVLTSDNHSNQLLQTFTDLYRNNILTDVTIVCDDKVKLFAHKIVLCAGSSFFRDFFVSNAHDKPLLFLKGVKQQYLQPLLQFMYNGETTISEDILNDLLRVANELEILGLKDEYDSSASDLSQRKEPILKEKTEKKKMKPPSPKKEAKEMFPCFKCTFQGVNKKSLEKHQQILHPELNSLKCNKCDFVGMNNESLRKHNTINTSSFSHRAPM